MVFDCEDQLSFDFYTMVLPLKRLYKTRNAILNYRIRRGTSFKDIQIFNDPHVCVCDFFLCVCVCVCVCDQLANLHSV